MKSVTKDAVSVKIPDALPENAATLDLWKDYSSRCISCGRCNFVCPTCTCFTMQDLFYRDNDHGRAGERRRVWASCQVDGYTDMAGGICFRKDPGERMRFKVLHKISDYKKRFGYHMCVGCGRCENICPEYISYTNVSTGWTLPPDLLRKEENSDEKRIHTFCFPYLQHAI